MTSRSNGAPASQSVELKIGRLTKDNHAGEWIDPAGLREHPRNNVYFTEGPPEALEALGEDLATTGFKTAVVITDNTCASGANVVLRGWRRTRAAALKSIEVPIVRASNLTAAQEEQVLVRDNLSDLQGRRYTPSERARLARGLGANYRELGLDLGVGSSPGSKKPRAAEVIAKVLGETTNGVKDLEAVYGSPHSTAELQAAVDEGKLSISAAVALVRDVGRDPQYNDAIKKVRAGTGDRTSDALLAEARAKVDASLKELVAERERPKAKPMPMPMPTEETAAREADNARAGDESVDLMSEVYDLAERIEAANASGTDIDLARALDTDADSNVGVAEDEKREGDDDIRDEGVTNPDTDGSAADEEDEPPSEKPTRSTTKAARPTDEPIPVAFRLRSDRQSHRAEFSIEGRVYVMTVPISHEAEYVGTLKKKK